MEDTLLGVIASVHLLLGAAVYRFIGWAGVIGGIIGIALYYATH